MGDHALAHPKVAAAPDPQNGEVAPGRVLAALRLDLRPAPEPRRGRTGRAAVWLAACVRR
jgi:hypothetical protein